MKREDDDSKKVDLARVRGLLGDTDLKDRVSPARRHSIRCSHGPKPLRKSRILRYLLREKIHLSAI